MYKQVEKNKENKSRAVANSVAQKKGDGRRVSGIVDNRNETPIIQRNQVEQLIEEEKPFVFHKNVRPYADATQFGHEFSIRLGILEPEQLFWLEKTNKPYLSDMREDSWNNMANMVADSDVFKDWMSVVGEVGYKLIKFTDPPSIQRTPNNYRKLEFYIHVVGNGGYDAITLKAVQELATDDIGNITISKFSFGDEKVYKSGSTEDEELSNPIWDE